MTAAELAAIRARAAAATSGPWKAEPNTAAGRVWVQRSPVPRPHRSEMSDCEPLFALRGPDAYQQREADAAFIASAREDVPALCDRVEALEAALRQADAALLSVAAFLPLFAADEAKVHRAQIAHGQYTEARRAIRAVMGAQ